MNVDNFLNISYKSLDFVEKNLLLCCPIPLKSGSSVKAKHTSEVVEKETQFCFVKIVRRKNGLVSPVAHNEN